MTVENYTQIDTETTNEDNKPKPKPQLKLKLDFNTKTQEAYRKENVELPKAIKAEQARIDKFLSKAKQGKGLEIILQSMHRRPKTYIEKGKRVTKDYLTFVVDYHSKDWLDNDLWIRGHEQGVHRIPKGRNVTSFNSETGEQFVKKKFEGEFETVYDIELKDESTRKKTIQDVLNKCDGTLLENVKFYYHVPPTGTSIAFRCSIFTFDQFLNSSVTELEKLAKTTVTPIAHQIKDKKDYMG